MNKLILAVIAGTFTVAAAAQTGTVSTAARQQAVTDATKVADHGTPAIHTEDAAKNVSASKGQPKKIANNGAAQEAVQQASKGSTK